MHKKKEKRMRKVLVGITLLALCVSPLSFAAEEAKAPKKETATKEVKASAEPAAPKDEKAPAGELKTSSQKLSYAAGMDLAASVPKELKDQLDLELFFRGFKDIIQGNKTLLTTEQTGEIKKEFFANMQAQQAEKSKLAGEKNVKEGEAYLAKNKTKQGVLTTSSGLQYEAIKEGAGPSPKASDQVSVHYRGTLIDGTEFDSSYKRNEPATFPVGGVIPGWTEGLQLMKAGGKYHLVIPSKLAYGERGAGPIGPNAVLVFDVELLKIEKAPEGGVPEIVVKP
jgi:FKBP-type peptidyl-prolyl cis-trans isomerase